MSDEHDSWFSSTFGIDLGGAAKRIEDEARAAAKRIEDEARAAQAQVTNIVQTVQKKVDGAIDEAVGAVTGVVKKVAGAAGVGGGGGGGAGGGAKPAAKSGGGTGKFPLSGSVGRGGQNDPNDVKAVQQALGVAVDGQCGGGTIKAIEEFQRSIGQSKPDGRVDAGGATERALASGAKPAAQGASGETGSEDILGKALAGAKGLAGAVAGGLGGVVGGLGGVAGGLSGGMLGGLADDISSFTDKAQKTIASIDPKSLRMDSGGATGDGGSSNVSPTNPNVAINPKSLDFQRGFQEGVNGGVSNPGPLNEANLANYEAGFAEGSKLRRSQSRGSGKQSDDYKKGHQDGLSGKEASPMPRGGEALEEYEDGYAKGRYEWVLERLKEEGEAAKKSREEVEEVIGHVVEHVTVHGVVHYVTHILKIGGGIFVMIVSAVAGMKCDTKLYRFKCATCGEQKNECTEEDARAAAEEHKHKFPGHSVDAKGPGMD